MNFIGCGHCPSPLFPPNGDSLNPFGNFPSPAPIPRPFKRVRSFERCALLPFQRWDAGLMPYELVGKATAC